MSGAEQLLGRLVSANNESIAAVRPEPNPMPVAELRWHRAVAATHDRMAAEWSAFDDAGLRLPHIGDLLTEDQGNEGDWRAGLLVADRRPVLPLADLFPATTAAARSIPGLRAALLSVLAPGAHILPHRGPNSGVLRYHLGISCGEESALRIGDTTVAYRDAEGILFDDTAEHEAWNRGTGTRVTLFCELDRPLRGRRQLLNRMTQEVLGLDPRYRNAPRRAREWHLALNPGQRGAVATAQVGAVSSTGTDP